MADVLSQSQIDALLKSMSADAPAQEKKTESVQFRPHRRDREGPGIPHPPESSQKIRSL